MKIVDLFEYKNKYYKPVPKKPVSRSKKTLWYKQYGDWVKDITTRFPKAKVLYDEENEEIIATSDDSTQCYGKWFKNKKDSPGVTFFKPLNIESVKKKKQKLNKIEVNGGFSGLF